MKGLLIVSSVLAGVIAVLMRSKHDEDALLIDYSSPPPLPIFVVVNMLAGLLRAMADTLTPPPIKMLDIATMCKYDGLCPLFSRFA